MVGLVVLEEEEESALSPCTCTEKRPHEDRVRSPPSASQEGTLRILGDLGRALVVSLGGQRAIFCDSSRLLFVLLSFLIGN